MGLFSSKKSVSGNSGNASNGGWTLTGTAGGKQKLGSMRKEWKSPRAGGGKKRP